LEFEVHIDKNSLICGVPAVFLRDSLPDSKSTFIPISIGNKMGLNNNDAQKLAKLLENENYIERENEIESEGCYRLTIKGSALKNANAAKPIRRETAEKAIKCFLNRVEEVNNEPKYLYETSDITVFGSYLFRKDYINDVDLAFDLNLKNIYNTEQLDTLTKIKIEEAINNGRIFNSYLDEIFWPYNEVILYLKSRSRILSFHSLKDGILESIEKKVLYRKST
jgi:hypothetical protein